jgi:hypothetical protein
VASHRLGKIGKIEGEILLTCPFEDMAGMPPCQAQEDKGM